MTVHEQGRPSAPWILRAGPLLIVVVVLLGYGLAPTRLPLIGEEEAELMVQGRTRHILKNGEPGQLPMPPGLQPGTSASSSRKAKPKSWFGRLFGG